MDLAAKSGFAGNHCGLFMIQSESSQPKKNPRRVGRGLLSNLGSRLRAVEQDACRLLFGCGLVRAYWAIEELVVFEIDLEEGWPLLNLSSNQRLRQRIFNVALQRAAQRTRTVAAIAESLVENPLLG